MAVQKNRNEQTPSNTAMADAMRTAGLNPQASQQAPQAEQPQAQAQQSQTQQQSFAQAGANVNQPSSRVGSRGRSVLDINANHRRPVGRNMAGEDVSIIFQGLKDRIAKTMNEQQKADFKLLVLDNNATPVTYSSILVCYKEAVNGQNHIAVYSLMVESSGSPLESSTVNINGGQVEVDVVPGDIYLHKSYWSVLEKFVIDSYGINALVHDGGCVIVNSETEEFTEQRFNRLLHNATQAVYTIMDNKLGSVEEPFTLGEVGANDQMIARVDFTRQHEENIVGLPVRGDIIVGMSAQTQTDAQFGLQQSRQLTRVTAYVDLMYQPAAAGFAQNQMQMGGMFQQQQPMATQMYQPRLVMTTIDTMTDAVTMELQLLALSTALGLNRNMHWSGTFRTHKGKGNDVDLKDLGALGYEINLTGDPQAKPDRLDTRSAEFGDGEMRQLINMLIAPKLIYTLDIEEAGELSWIHQTFIAAANGNEDARMAILQAANNLTMGHFQTLFNAAAPVCYDDQDRIHLGYYYDREGNRRDLRELDYVAILNLAGKTNPKLVEAWEDTHRNTNIALEVRLDQRKAILRQLISGDIVIKGFARRVSFDNAFLDALSAAIVKSGLNVRPAKGLDDNANLIQRGGYALDHLVVNQNVGDFFNYGTAQQQNSRLFSSPFTGNWGRN
ncbi:hypothetical protein D3C85_107850 [compost metagenome]